MNIDMKTLLAVVAFVATTQTLHAGSAIWKLSPASNQWQTAENWTPATVPNSDNDTATFGPSNTINVALGTWSHDFDGATTLLDTLIFGPGAVSYTITITPDWNYGVFLALDGGGVSNNSGALQKIVVAASGDIRRSAGLGFNGSATAGENMTYTNEGGASETGDGRYGAGTVFSGVATAATATFMNNGGTVSGAEGGVTDLLYSSTADGATFTSNPGTVSGALAGYTLIQTLGDLGASTFIGNPATVPGAEGGWVEIDFGITSGTNFIANGASVADCQAGQIYVYGAGYGTGEGVATFTGNGGNGSGAEGGLIDLFALPRSDQTVVIAKAGRNGGLGGNIIIEGDAVLDLGQFQLFGDGTLDLTNVTSGGMTIGSLAGNGLVLLDGHSLNIGNNNLNTSFSGIIQDSGSLVKLGSGMFTLSGANTYTGATTVTAGTLRLNNQTGSATGTGGVKVNAGSLGGKGTIAGAVTVGTGSGAGAVLAPSVGSNQPAILTLKKALSFKADSTYTYKLNTNNARAD